MRKKKKKVIFIFFHFYIYIFFIFDFIYFELIISSHFTFTSSLKQVGTLDALVALSDELSKHDTFGESVVKKLSQLLSDLLEDHKEKLAENLLVNESESMEEYIYICKCR